MAKNLRIRDFVLLGLAIAGDTFSEFTQSPSIKLGKIKGTLPPNYGVTNFTSAVSKMLKTGQIEKIIKKGEPYLRLTNNGKKILIRDFPLFKLRNQKWNGKWRLVFYDIPEKMRTKREYLQTKLKELGFGMIQESVYLSPFDLAEDLEEFIISQGLQDYVFIHVGKQIIAGEIKSLVEKLWKIESLDKRYEEILLKIKSRKEQNEIFKEYEEILKDDPCLPLDLLPNNWVGERVRKEMGLLFKPRSG
ncbi:CRISPR-associated endonuclease Cas2 [Candidatus Shapirobacteria bacterium CG08_land_8_20_14_0_20_39_18]|uniref:CRISPR-associated endonuclease Cas2 n=1 Tax=Candidatus Shapirobacteria bacterium CG08_land_8_20_14_0_20_39_18 TaxID=1974883 RepID=A0A2M6XC75_9BACT|nr:MAG: CRISPR-associated endonuclease Cas2 [Candidatus Shapirobacteria bacterium CG08_land_8_20_14_0_20_39_18]PIY66049.1 MAG: CRISPR-associated endonuclease Cas2 [Candidatus Shapirobacteria bacterium CG_4_10_14_0_8_um_filter_39_15]PJE68733.1 MAG: CRISPR-associated endonuclease Cas2 [Candidatus Shapirobacteria bacterium CG10_big_fil_rev_8_21_14_0_10_38_8]